MRAERVRLEQDGCVGTLVLNRPEARNALDSQAVEELSGLLWELAAEEGVRVVKLVAEGTCFSAGADLRAMGAMGSAPPEDNLADARRFVEMLSLLHSLPKPTVASVQGAAVGGGVGLVACCDIAIASEDAFFRLSEVQLGLVPSMVGPYLVEAMGARMTRRMMLSAERVDARTAMQWGLVHHVAPAEGLEAAVGETVSRLLRGAPGALALCKQLVQEFASLPLDAALRERTAQVLSARRSSEEGRAGVQAFLDKSMPPWAIPPGDGNGECEP